MSQTTNLFRKQKRISAIIHVDMDAFFASVEQKDNPALKGKPTIIANSAEKRGVVCAASYEARKFGVNSAMPTATALKLCPHGHYIKPRIARYREESAKVMEIFRRETKIIEAVSIDEAYLDITNKLLPTPTEPKEIDTWLESARYIAKNIKDTIQKELNLSASAGIGSNKFIAKIGSAYKKPNGLTIIPDSTKVSFLAPLDIRKIHGVGAVTEKLLKNAGIRKISDIQNRTETDLIQIIGSFGETLKAFAHGIDNRSIDTSNETKSISGEETFSNDTMDQQEIETCLKEIATEVAKRLQDEKLTATTVQVKVKYFDFKSITRQITLSKEINSETEIYQFSCELVAKHKLINKPIRLIGLGVASLKEAKNQQLELSIT